MALTQPWRTIPIFLIVVVLFIPATQAETPFDVTECAAGLMTMVYHSKEMAIYGIEGKGIFISHHENKVFDNFTFQVVAIGKIEGDKRTSESYWKIVDPDGDIIIAEVIVVIPEKTMRFLHGTGKWKGIKGGGKGKGVTAGKPITPGTLQACSRYMGTFELPKQVIKINKV